MCPCNFQKKKETKQNKIENYHLKTQESENIENKNKISSKN
jgi:hypothetical protein